MLISYQGRDKYKFRIWAITLICFVSACSKGHLISKAAIRVDCRPGNPSQQIVSLLRVSDSDLIEINMDNKYGYELVMEAPVKSLENYGSEIGDQTEDPIWYFPLMGAESVRSDEERFNAYLKQTVKTTRYSFRIGDLKMVPSPYRSKPQKVFNAAGSYLVYVSKNFGRTAKIHDKACEIHLDYSP